MGFLDKLLRRAPSEAPAVVEANVECTHGALVPRWDSAADMGNADKVTSYRCDSCGQEFAADEIAELRASTAARLRDLNEPPSQN